MSKPVYIYVLIDPLTNQCRYVGKTVNIKNRFKDHCKDNSKSKKQSWLKSILPLKPEMLIIEETQNWIEAEQFWIAYLRYLGSNLTNLAKGGEGSHGYKLTDVQKARLGNSKRREKLSTETRIKLSETHKGNKYGLGYKHTPEAKAKIAASNKLKIGKTRSEESKKRMSEAAKLRPRKPLSEETKRKIALAHLGKTRIILEETKAKLSIAAKLDWAKRKELKRLSV